MKLYARVLFFVLMTGRAFACTCGGPAAHEYVISGYITTHYLNPQQACEAYATLRHSQSPNRNYTFSSVTPGTIGGGNGYCNTIFTVPPGTFPNPEQVAYQEITGTTCYACPPSSCSIGAPGQGETFTVAYGSSTSYPLEYCNAATGCKMKAKAQTSGTTTIEHSSENCGSAPNDPATPTSGTPESCQSVGSGEYCASATGDGQCGYMNDTYVCLKKVAPNECKPLGDGSRVCDSQAKTTPPVPDNGTPGVVATPTGSLSQTSPVTGGTTQTRTYSYFSSTVVAASSRDPGTDGAVPSGGSPGGETAGEPTDIGDPCEGSDCTAGTPDLEDVGTLSDAFSGFWSNLQDVPIVAAAGDIAPSFSGGACPDWQTTIDVFDTSIAIDFTGICSLWTDISGALSAVCLVMFGLLAFRILFSA